MLDRAFEALKNDEGAYDLSKLEGARIFPAVKEAAAEADADGDGFLNAEELDAAKALAAEKTANAPVPAVLAEPCDGMGGPGGPRTWRTRHGRTRHGRSQRSWRTSGPGMGSPGGPGGASTIVHSENIVVIADLDKRICPTRRAEMKAD